MKKQLIWCCALVLCLNFHTLGLAQDNDETSSRRDVAVVKAIEAAGGKVYKISAADESREVSFYLSSKPIKDEHLKDINAIREVIWMNLAGTEITNDGLKHLEGLPLKKLHLERTKIGDDGLKHLASFKDLEYLNVYATEVTDAGLEHLKGLKNLRKLYVWQSKVTEAGMKKLNESLPELEIVGEVKLEPVVIEEPKKKEEEKKAGDKKEDKKKGEAKKEKEPADKANAEKEAKKDDKQAKDNK